MSEPVRLLIVGDAEADRRELREAIEHGASRVELAEASAADEALSKIAAGPFDCVLVGHAPPRSSGLELTQRLRATGDVTPVVFVTDQLDEDLLREATAAGATDFYFMGELSPVRLGFRIRCAIRIGRAEASAARSLAVVSHDLRGPLHAISLACDALSDEVTPDALRYLGAIERASDRAERLISNLLEASAIEAGGLTLSCASIDARSIVRQAVADHELLVREVGGRIVEHLPESPTLVFADRDRVREVLSNLIGNAIKHARGASIEIGIQRLPSQVRVFVRDHGPGISAAELPQVFERYWRGSTRKQGAGLGLAIAKGIVDAHGGVIGVVSRHGEGAEFAFTLPLAIP